MKTGVPVGSSEQLELPPEQNRSNKIRAPHQLTEFFSVELSGSVSILDDDIGG
jgi:hypothetical protein